MGLYSIDNDNNNDDMPPPFSDQNIPAWNDGCSIASYLRFSKSQTHLIILGPQAY